MLKPLLKALLSSSITAALVQPAQVQAVDFPDTNRVALWLTKNIVSHDSGRAYTIPNTWSEETDDGNLLKNAAHPAGATAGGVQTWTTTNATLTADQTGPDGKTSGTRVLAGAANGNYISSGITFTAGTYTIVVPIKSNTGSGQTVKIGQSSTLTAKAVTTSWAEYAAVFTLGASAGGLTLAQDNGAGTMDVLVGTPRLYAGDVSANPPAAVPLHGALKLGMSDSTAPTVTGTSMLTFGAGRWATASWDDGIDFTSGDATHFYIVKRATNPAGIAAILGLRENVTRHMLGLRGAGRMCHGDSFAQTKHQQGILLGGDGWQVIGVVVDSTANERRFYVGRQLVQILSGIGSNTSTTDRDFTLGLVSGGNTWGGDFIGGGMYNRALSAVEWAQLCTACETEIVAHGETPGTVHPLIVVEGDSITSDNAGNVSYYASEGASLLSTRALIVNLAVPGDNIEDVDARRTTRQRYLSDTANRTCTLSFWATNDVELAGYPATYATVGQDIATEAKLDGFDLVLACTLTPKTTANYNVNRATVNASIAAFTSVDGICDFAANTAYGEDVDASNASLYPDGVHPSATVQSAPNMATDWSNAVNAL